MQTCCYVVYLLWNNVHGTTRFSTYKRKLSPALDANVGYLNLLTRNQRWQNDFFFRIGVIFVAWISCGCQIMKSVGKCKSSRWDFFLDHCGHFFRYLCRYRPTKSVEKNNVWIALVTVVAFLIGWRRDLSAFSRLRLHRFGRSVFRFIIHAIVIPVRGHFVANQIGSRIFIRMIQNFNSSGAKFLNSLLFSIRNARTLMRSLF